MKKLIIIFFIIFTLIGIVHTRSYAYEKIGFYDTRAIMQKSEAGKKAYQALQKIYDAKKVIINNAEKDLRERKNYLDKNKLLSPSASYKELESDYQKRFNDYKDLVNNANEELKQKDRELVSKVAPLVLYVVKRIKDEEKYTDLLDKSLQLNIDEKPWPAAVSYSQDKDITDKIVTEINRLSGMNQASGTVISTDSAASTSHKE